MNERHHSQYPWWFAVLMAPIVAAEKVKDGVKKVFKPKTK